MVRFNMPIVNSPHRRFLTAATVLLYVAACGKTGPAATPPIPAPLFRSTEVITLLRQLSDDSLRGRLTGSPGARRAAEMIAGEMRRLGLEPAGDSGYFQRVPLYRVTDANGRPELRLAASWAELDSLPAGRRRVWAVNVIGRLVGSDRSLGDEHILVDAHYDHIGTAAEPGSYCTAVGADSICNGADDDASGIVATLKIAQAMRNDARHRRTILFAAMTGEELGLFGAQWYTQNPVAPLRAMVANLEIEMIGRPDSLAGGQGKAWLTGYHRSTMGEMLAAAGIPLGPDRRPAYNFFRRSDNYALALRGVVAHTLSSFNLHADYHQPGDEAAKVDSVHLAGVIEAAARAVRLLADGPRPEWKPGGKPEPPSGSGRPGAGPRG